MSISVSDTIKKIQEGIAARQLEAARNEEPREAFIDWLIQTLGNYANAGAKQLVYNYTYNQLHLSSNFAMVSLVDICTYIYGYSSSDLFKETPALAAAFSSKYTLRFATQDKNGCSITRVYGDYDFSNTETLLESFETAINGMHQEVSQKPDYTSMESRTIDARFDVTECLKIFAKFIPYLMWLLPDLEAVTIKLGDVVIEDVKRTGKKSLNTMQGDFTLECTKVSTEARIKLLDVKGEREIYNSLSGITAQDGKLKLDGTFSIMNALPVVIKNRGEEV